MTVEPLISSTLNNLAKNEASPQDGNTSTTSVVVDTESNPTWSSFGSWQKQDQEQEMINIDPLYPLAQDENFDVKVVIQSNIYIYF